MLSITGLIGISGLCNFSCVFSVGGKGFFCIRYFIFLLSLSRLHCCYVFCVSCWYLTLGSFWIKWQLLSVRNICTFLEYSSKFMISIVFLLSALTSIAFSFTSFWFNFLVLYNCIILYGFVVVV